MVFGGLLAAGGAIAGGLFGSKRSGKATRQGLQNVNNAYNSSLAMLSDLLNRNVDMVNSFKNPEWDAANASLNGIDSALGSLTTDVRSSRNALADLPALLQRGALANTDPARRSALRNARAGVGSRGLAFSAAAGDIGARAGQQATSEQSAALSSSMVTARTAQAQQLMAALQMESQLAGLRQQNAQLRFASAGMRENRLSLLANLFATDAGQRAALAGQNIGAIAGLSGANIGAQGQIGNTVAGGIGNAFGGLSGSSFADFLKGIF